MPTNPITEENFGARGEYSVTDEPNHPFPDNEPPVWWYILFILIVLAVLALTPFIIIGVPF